MSLLQYEPQGGIVVTEAIERAIKIAAIAGIMCELKFNGSTVIVCPSHADQVYRDWQLTRPDGRPTSG